MLVFDLLLKVWMGVIGCLAMIKWCRRKYLWVRLLCLVRLWENACVIQCGRRCVDAGGLKGFVQRLVLNLISLNGYLVYFVGKLSVVMGVL